MTTTPTVQFWNGSAWTDISTKVKSYSYTAGRLDEISGASAGQAMFVLDNADSSVVAVGVNLLPKMTPIRVMVNGNTQARFTGWVDGSPVTFRDPEGTSTLVTVTAADSLALMQRHKCQTSIYEETLATAIQTSSPGALVPSGIGYWPLSDPAGSVSAAEVSGTGTWPSMDTAALVQGAQITPGGPIFGLAGVDTTQTTGAAGFVGSSTPNGSLTTATGVTMGVWMRWPATFVGDPVCYLEVRFGSGGTFHLQGQGSSGGNLIFEAQVTPTGATGGNYVTWSQTLDSNWHYLQAVCDDAGNMKLYVDGVLRGTATATTWTPAQAISRAVIVGYSTLTGVANTTPAQVCHAWIAQGQNTSTTVAGSTAPLRGLTTTSFLAKLATWAEPRGFFGSPSIDAQNNGAVTPTVTLNGNDCLSLAQVAVDAEDGPLYCNRAGLIANLTHRTLTDRATGAATAAFVNGDVESDLMPARDAQFLITNAQITALSGSGGVLTASRNLTKFGSYLLQKSLYVTDAQATDYATWKTLTYGDINYSRVGKFTIDLLCSTDIQTAALAIDVGSRVTFTGLPAQAGFTTADVIVQGFTENWTIDGWSISFNTTPSSSYISWILEDATYGLLEQTTVLGY
ncbi:MAG: hypothetical protein NVS3B1_29600 [Marmoricola sp.]